MPEINRRQAMVPSGALVLPNAHGTAPGLMLDAGDVPVILLPGPPREMKPMFDNEVAPRLAARAAGRRLVTRVLKTTGRSESQIEEAAFPVYSRLGSPGVAVETTILASPGQIELHLSAAGADAELLSQVLDDGVRALERALGRVVFSIDGRSIEQVVGELLRDRGLTIAVAESCTGGLMLGRLTDVPGSSAWVVGGVVAYDNAVKVEQLGVSSEHLVAYGAVSEPVARAMAELEHGGADAVISGLCRIKHDGSIQPIVIPRRAEIAGRLFDKNFGMTGSNLVIRRSAFERAGGFDPALPVIDRRDSRKLRRRSSVIDTADNHLSAPLE
jgi:nicotinamide-nucleotide amidase